MPFPEKSNHIPFLDGLRGFAVLLVMLHHFTFLKPSTASGQFFVKAMHMGGHGVDLFFVLSGFLITDILIKNRNADHLFRNFYARRFLRIFPLYYLFLTLSLFILPAFLSKIPAASAVVEEFRSAQNHWPWYFLYLSNFWIALKGYYGRGGLDISWSLAIEEHFYIFWPLIVSKCKGFTLPKICLGILFLTLASRFLLLLLGFSPLQIYVSTLTRLDGLALGSFIASSLALPDFNLQKTFWNQKILLALNFISIVILFSLGFLNESHWFFNIFGYFLIAIFFTQLLTVLLSSPKSGAISAFFNSRLLIFLGTYSYALYLVHIPIGALLKACLFQSGNLEELPGNPYYWQLLFYPLSVGMSCTAALVSWHFFEKPILSLKRFFPLKPLSR